MKGFESQGRMQASLLFKWQNQRGKKENQCGQQLDGSETDRPSSEHAFHPSLCVTLLHFPFSFVRPSSTIIPPVLYLPSLSF